MQQALEFAREHHSTFKEQLIEYLAIPSISTDPDHRQDVRACAHWLAEEYRRIGLEDVTLLETDGNPAVYARRMEDPSKPTVLCYGHYDVQPPDPLELWETPPFEPRIVDGTIYARGACDDKGQMFMHAKAVESYLSAERTLPVNVIFLSEGEEEIGSAHLTDVIEEHADRLQADVVLISDTAMFSEDLPSIISGLRGLAYLNITVKGPKRDLHSGTYGGAVENPLNALAKAIGALHDKKHQVAIPGFYTDVRPLTEEERREIEQLPLDPEEWAESIGIPAPRTEVGYSIWECITGRPTLDVNGIWGGYQGDGAKTVLPSEAGAKISMRLVPDQDPDDIAEKASRHIRNLLPDTVTVQIDILHGGDPVLADRDHPGIQAAVQAIETVRGTKPALTRHGGSIPIVADFQNMLGLQPVLMGFGLDDDAIHSPNEHFDLERFYQGTEAAIHFFHNFAEME